MGEKVSGETQSFEDGKIVNWNEGHCRQFLAEVFGGRREDF